MIEIGNLGFVAHKIIYCIDEHGERSYAFPYKSWAVERFHEVLKYCDVVFAAFFNFLPSCRKHYAPLILTIEICHIGYSNHF